MSINDFPTELLEEIFLRTVSQSQESLSSPPYTRCGSSPASLCAISKICRRWKDIALNFAPLWTHLHVVDPQEVSILQDLEVWMHRAGTLPLCFSLRQKTSYDLVASAAVATYFLKSLQRCHSFEMSIYTNRYDFCFKDIEKVISTSLESVSVSCGGWSWTDAQLLSNLLLNTRSLRTISWSCGLLSPRNIIPHPWENLRELSINSIGTLDEFFDALSHCQNLERLKIHEVLYGNVHFLKPISVILPRVTHLSIRSSEATHTPIFGPLILPSLTELEIIMAHKLTAWTPIVDLLQRSGGVLRSLGIINPGGYHNLCQAEFIRILKMPYFQELRILEVEEPMVAGCGIVKLMTLPSVDGNTSRGGKEETGYLVHLERISLVFEGTGARRLRRFLERLVESRLGRMSDPELARWHIEVVKTRVHFSLSIPSTT